MVKKEEGISVLEIVKELKQEFKDFRTEYKTDTLNIKDEYSNQRTCMWASIRENEKSIAKLQESKKTTFAVVSFFIVLIGFFGTIGIKFYYK